MTREEITRHQLGAATQLFIDDSDAISVHCLACSAAEHASFLAKQAGEATFNDHVQSAFPDRSIRDIRAIRNQDWVAIKHARDNSGVPFDFPKALIGFDDTVNDHMLFVVWYDYSAAGLSLPIPAQVFQVWYYAMYPEKLSSTGPDDVAVSIFGEIRKLNRRSQKRALKDKVAHFSKDAELRSNPKTDLRPLLLSNN